MHLQQTKRQSRRSGGPQYYLHDLTEPVKDFLQRCGLARVALVTPYGATLSDYLAVSKNKKLNSEYQAVPGEVGHDRIQQGRASESIGEAIRQWYRLPVGDFERIDVSIEIRDDAFYVAPTKYKFVSKKPKKIILLDRPLSFTVVHQSSFWIAQLRDIAKHDPGLVIWSVNEINRIARDHLKGTKLPHIQETDILRASGPLNHLGVTLGGFVGKGYDCKTTFRFQNYPDYSVPVELKRNSTGFRYQLRKYGKDELSRAVILCAKHEEKNIPPHIDVIELAAFATFDPRILRRRK